MPRNSSDTKARLLNHAEKMFAEDGIFAVTNRQITEAAGQKNESALNYHFGTRNQLIVTLLTRRGKELDTIRAELLEHLGDKPTTRELVQLLVEVYASCLHTESGCDYLRIVDQLRGWMTDWEFISSFEDDNVHEHLRYILGLLQKESDSQRVIGMIMLMTAMTASRAQLVSDGRKLPNSHVEYVETLADMLTGVLLGPSA
jgi:AcrR family transcriptional regulator|tara:strand:- start:33208 stop:33810 length:603 start_codon:yes stop_codon:yes gene_type:complete